MLWVWVWVWVWVLVGQGSRRALLLACQSSAFSHVQNAPGVHKVKEAVWQLSRDGFTDVGGAFHLRRSDEGPPMRHCMGTDAEGPCPSILAGVKVMRMAVGEIDMAQLRDPACR